MANPMPQSLQDVLAADDQTLRQWSKQMPAQPPSLYPEEMLTLALSQAHPLEETATAKTPWWSLSWLMAPQYSFALATCVLLLFVGGGLWSILPQESGPEGFAKGAYELGFQQKPSLHVGLLKKNKLSRLSNGESIQTHQKLVIAYSILEPGGYIYIFRHAKGQPSLIYPCDEASRKQQSPSDNVRLLSCKGIIQQDDLESERGALHYLLLQAGKPLPPGQLRDFQRGSKQNRLKLLKTWYHQGRLHHFDQFSLHVKE